MGRYRPPQPRGAKYITPGGKQALEQELKHLLQTERPRVTAALSEAAKEGDRSENAEYIYRKKQLREMDRRIRYLIKRNEEVNVVHRLPEDQSAVYFGAWVLLEDECGVEHRFRIVGTDERDPKAGLISIDSPMAQSLLKKKVDDEVSVCTHKGVKYYSIVRIEYID